MAGGWEGRAGGMIGTVLCYVLLPVARLLRALRGNRPPRFFLRLPPLQPPPPRALRGVRFAVVPLSLCDEAGHTGADTHVRPRTDREAACSSARRGPGLSELGAGGRG